MTSTMHARRAQTRTPENDDAQAVAAALGIKGLSTASDEYCARRLIAVQLHPVSAHGSDFSATRTARSASMPHGEEAIKAAANDAHMPRIARSLAQHGFRLRSTSDGWRIEPHRRFALKDHDGERT